MNWKVAIVNGLLMTISFFSFAQNSVGIGVANPNKNAVLELVSPGNNQGLMIPKLTTAQRTATAFISSLSAAENGLMVFDKDDNKFYFWQGSQWKPLDNSFNVSGTGLMLTGNTLSAIPQDLQLSGSTLSITNNPSATPINLSAFTGTNSDDQTLTFNAVTGELAITRLTGGNQSVNLTSVGTAGGDLTGTFPSPLIALNAVTSAKILDGTILSADILDNTITNLDILDGTVLGADIAADAITSAKILDGTVSGADIQDGSVAVADLAADAVTTAKILDGTIAAADLANLAVTDAKIATGISVNKLAVGTAGQVLTTNAGVATWLNLPSSVSSITAGTGLTGGTITTSGTINLANTTVTTGSYGSATQVAGFTVDAQGRLTSAGNITISGIAPGGAASNDLTGTYPGPSISANAVTSSKILDGTIVDADVSSTAAISVQKLAPGVVNQVLTTSGGIAQWATFSGSPLINNAGTLNLFAGGSVGGATTGSDNAFFGAFAGNANTAGKYNTIMGTQAGQFKSLGDLNTLIGWMAGQAFGSLASYNGNTFVGAQAGQVSTSGPNTFIGEKAGVGNTSGTQSVFVGNAAGSVNTIGGQHTILGYNADVSANNLQNATAIGFGAIVNANNKVRLGNTSVTTIEGQVPFSNPSDRRLKANITNIDNGLDFVRKLRPVSYTMKNGDGRTNWGFIAQEIEGLVGINNAILTIQPDGDRTLGLRYTDFIAPLVNAVQQQQKEIEDLQAKLSNKEKEIAAVEASLKELGNLKEELEKIKKVLGMEAKKN